MHKLLRRHIVALTLGSAVALSAQIPKPLDDALRAIFERNEYAAESIGPTAWLDGGRRYTSVSRGAEKASSTASPSSLGSPRIR